MSPNPNPNPNLAVLDQHELAVVHLDGETHDLEVLARDGFETGLLLVQLLLHRHLLARRAVVVDDVLQRAEHLVRVRVRAGLRVSRAHKGVLTLTVP